MDRLDSAERAPHRSPPAFLPSAGQAAGLAGVVAVLLALGGCDSIASSSDWSVRIGLLASDADDPSVQVPATAEVGEPVTVRVTTSGGGCDRAEGTRVERADDGITVVPRDSIYLGDQPCPAVLLTFEHEAVVEFDEAGEANVRFRVRDPNGGSLLEIARTVDVGRTATRGGDPPFLLTQSSRPETAMDALYQGPVEADAAGCLRLDLSERPAAIWPPGYTLVGEDAGYVVRSPDGETAGRIGGIFRLAGGIVPFLHEGVGLSAADRRRAEETCPGRYWIVADVLDD